MWLSGNSVLFMRGSKHMPVPWEDITLEFRAQRGRKRELERLCPVVVCEGDARRELEEYGASMARYTAQGNQEMVDFCVEEAAVLQAELNALDASASGVQCTLHEDAWADVVHVTGKMLTRGAAERAIAGYLRAKRGINNPRFRWKEDKDKDCIRLYTM